jgi:hypothetical protein
MLQGHHEACAQVMLLELAHTTLSTTALFGGMLQEPDIERLSV